MTMNEKRTYIRDGRSPIPKNETISKIMSSIKDRDTKPELILRKALWSTGIKGYRIHWKSVPGKPDIAFPGKKFAIFVNGCFWHRCPNCSPPMPKSNRDFWQNKFRKNIERDRTKITQLKKQGWETVTIWECQIIQNKEDCVEKIRTIMFY